MVSRITLAIIALFFAPMPALLTVPFYRGPGEYADPEPKPVIPFVAS
ncbi:MAG: hypothetical protein ACU4EQ_00430 [Candidatus Nitrosoglobus sp.]|jgi:hypothetical protein